MPTDHVLRFSLFDMAWIAEKERGERPDAAPGNRSHEDKDMLSRIRALQFKVTQPIHDYFVRRVEFALGRFSDRVRSIESRMLDLNGPAGGVDKLCAITVHAQGVEPIRVRAIASDLYEAIDRAAHLAGAQLTRALDRRRTRNLALGRRAKQFVRRIGRRR